MFNIDQINTMSQAEINAIQFHINALHKIIPTLEKFDGKVINKRLQTAIKEDTDIHISLGLVTFQLFCHEYVNNKRGNSTRADYYRDITVNLETNSTASPYRLDSAATIKGIHAQIEKMEEASERFEVSESEVQNAQAQLDIIHTAYRNLYDTTNNPHLRSEIYTQFKRLT